MPSVYLYVLDALRFDFVGCYNSEEPNTPHLDQLSNDGVRFSNAVAQATFTELSAPSLLTGLYPVALGLYPKGLGLGSDARHFETPLGISTLGSLFKNAGFHTSAFCAHPLVGSQPALRRGFDEIPNMYEEPGVKEREDLALAMAEKFSRRRKPIALVTSKDLHAARRSRGHEPSRDEFILFWAVDVHAPLFDRNRIDEINLDDPELIDTLWSALDNLPLARKLYRQMIAFADQQLGEFLDELKEAGIYEESTIIVTADHGESFGEGDMYGHGGFPYESQIHIPLIVKYPHDEFAGQVCDALVGLIDIVPMLTKLHDLPLSNPVHGQELTSVVRGDSSGHQGLIAQCPTLDREWDCIAYRSDSEKFLECSFSLEPSLSQRIGSALGLSSPNADVRQIFDLIDDPGEEHNLIQSSFGEAVEARARRALNEYRLMVQEFFEMYVGDLGVAQVDERVKQRLADLGYLD